MTTFNHHREARRRGLWRSRRKRLKQSRGRVVEKHARTRLNAGRDQLRPGLNYQRRSRGRGRTGEQTYGRRWRRPRNGWRRDFSRLM